MFASSLIRLVGIFALVLTASCGDGPGTTCESDDDCASYEQCIGSGGLFFGGRVCAAVQTSIPLDAGMQADGDFDADDPGDSGTDPDLPEAPDQGADMGTDSGPPDMGCTPVPPGQLCDLAGANCGQLAVLDPCTDTDRMVACGDCTAPESCGGGGIANVCGCEPETDGELCTILDAECGRVEASDSCGTPREADCGSCPATEACGAANICRPDGDSDGIVDSDDNCPAVPNPAQADGDNDSIGNPCDNCPGTANPLQEDGDQNLVGDACQVLLIDQHAHDAGGDEPELNFELNNDYTDALFVMIVSWDDDPANADVQSLSGLGLSWNLNYTQCAADGDIRVDVYTAYGDGQGNDNIRITFTNPARNPIAHVLVFQNANAMAPLYAFDEMLTAPCPGPANQSLAFAVDVDVASPGDFVIGSVAWDQLGGTSITPPPILDTNSIPHNLTTSAALATATGTYPYSGQFITPGDYLALAFAVRSSP